MTSAPLPLISQLIPLDVEAALLEQTLRSALLQIYPNFEVILAGPASPEAMACALRYAALDSRVRFEPCALEGLDAARRCFELARGDFVVFLRPGDRLVPHALGRLAAPLLGMPGVILAAGKHTRVDAAGAPLPDTPSTALLFAQDTHLPGMVFGDLLLRAERNLLGALSGVLFSRGTRAAEALFRIGGTSFRANADLALWLALLAEGDGAYLAEPLCYVRERPHAHDALHEWPTLLKAAQATGFLADVESARRAWVACLRRLSAASLHDRMAAAMLPLCATALGDPTPPEPLP
ncbi:MAG TPA: glycosyltransferase, partial [Oscillatoriaceae cyanobacterium]